MVLGGRRRVRATACVLLMVVAVATATSGASISNAASFLDLGLGASSLALGNACVALGGGIDSLLMNPAGLYRVEGVGISSSYETRWETCGFGHISAASRGIGFSIAYFDFGSIPETDRDGNPLGFFSYQDVALLLGATVIQGDSRFVGEWGVGVTGKLVKMGDQNSADSGKGGAVDLGLLARLDHRRLPWLLSEISFGARLENLISTGISWGVEGNWESWPVNAVIGASIGMADILLIAFESDLAEGLRLGIEFAPIPQLAIRAGLRQEGTPMWSLGLGIRVPRFAFDYAVVLHRYLPAEHRLTFTVNIDL